MSCTHVFTACSVDCNVSRCSEVMLNSVDLRANIAVMKILVKLLIQDYLHIPCKKKQLMKNTGW